MKKRQKDNKLFILLFIIIIVIIFYYILISNNQYKDYYVIKEQKDILNIEDSYYNINTYKNGSNNFLYEEIKYIIPSIRSRIELQDNKIYRISDLDNKDIILSIIRPIIGSNNNVCLSLQYINEKTNIIMMILEDYIVLIKLILMIILKCLILKLIELIIIIWMLLL